MGALAKFVKDPDETKRYVITWEDWLDSGEKLESAYLEVNVDTGPDDAVLAEIESYTISADLLAVVFFVSGGVAGVGYKITVRVHTSGGQIKEDCVLISVRNC
jgi:uncharacterized protein (DUF934 family)